MTAPTHCKKCNAVMIWAKSPSGANLPLDASPITGPADPRVTPRAIIYRLDGDHAVVVSTQDEVLKARTAGQALYLSHFVTCPHAASFSRRNRP